MNIYDCKQAFAEPGERNMIDLIHPVTGKSLVYGESLDQIRVRYPQAEIVDINQWTRLRAVEQDSPIEWTETTEEKYNEMLNVLPPAAMGRGGFLVGEPVDHHATTGAARFEAYKAVYGKFYVANRPMRVSEFRAQLNIQEG